MSKYMLRLKSQTEVSCEGGYGFRIRVAVVLFERGFIKGNYFDMLNNISTDQRDSAVITLDSPISGNELESIIHTEFNKDVVKVISW